jgi:hypothetical protein
VGHWLRTSFSHSNERRLWPRKGSAFTLLFEQAALALVREMPVLAAARLRKALATLKNHNAASLPPGPLARQSLAAISRITGNTAIVAAIATPKPIPTTAA